MEDDLNSSFINELNNSATFVNKRKRIRKLIPGVCKYCNKWFNDGRNLYAHVRIHTGVKPFVCKVCHKAFNQSSNFRRHLVVHNPAERKTLTCNICERQYLDKQYFEEHLRAHNGIKPYPCPLCSKKFSHRASLRRHLPTHENQKSYICRICEKSFAFENLLNYHMRIHYKGEKSFECTLCKRVFSRSCHFHSHLMSIHNIKVAFQCNICNRRFPDKRALEMHYLNHRVNKCSAVSQVNSETENESVQCFENDITKYSDLYNKYFQDEKSLEKHYTNHKVDKISEASQDKLEIRNDSVQGFENGIIKSSNLTEAFEDLCEEQEIMPIENFETDFTKNEQLPEVSSTSQFEFEEIEIEPELYFNNSTTNSRYFCGICYEEISGNTNVQEHLHNHTQQGNFVCSKCKNCFDSKSLLEQHTCSSDNDAELFECYICEETFPSKENLKKHLFKHTEEDTTYS